MNSHDREKRGRGKGEPAGSSARPEIARYSPGIRNPRTRVTWQGLLMNFAGGRDGYCANNNMKNCGNHIVPSFA